MAKEENLGFSVFIILIHHWNKRQIFTQICYIWSLKWRTLKLSRKSSRNVAYQLNSSVKTYWTWWVLQCKCPEILFSSFIFPKCILLTSKLIENVTVATVVCLLLIWCRCRLCDVSCCWHVLFLLISVAWGSVPGSLLAFHFIVWFFYWTD